MNTWFLSIMLLNISIFAADANQNTVNFPAVPKDGHGNILPRCIICEKHGADSYLINRFAPSIHRKCYDPILEIEPAYAKALYDMLKMNNSSIERDDVKHKAARTSLIGLAAKKSKEAGFSSFQAYSQKYGKYALENLFWKEFISLTRKKPFAAQCDWELHQLYPDRFIPQGNENILE